MHKSIYEQLRDADLDIQKQNPVTWKDISHNQTKGIIKNKRKIYIVTCIDKITKVSHQSFFDFDEALKSAKSLVEKNCHNKEEIKKIKIKGYLYYVIYSSEGDCVFLAEYSFGD